MYNKLQSAWCYSAPPAAVCYDAQARPPSTYFNIIIFASVADPGCLSRILIFTHPGSRIPDLGSRIPDPKTATKERGEKKLVVIPFYVATNFTKL